VVSRKSSLPAFSSFSCSLSCESSLPALFLVTTVPLFLALPGRSRPVLSCRLSRDSGLERPSLGDIVYKLAIYVDSRWGFEIGGASNGVHGHEPEGDMVELS
jgi:hypothetical protein